MTIIKINKSNEIYFHDRIIELHNEKTNEKISFNVEEIKNFKIRFKKINWGISIISFLIDIITGYANSKIFKQNLLLIGFDYKNNRELFKYKTTDKSIEDKINLIQKKYAD